MRLEIISTQWVPFALSAMALFFYFPRGVWKILSINSGTVAFDTPNQALLQFFVSFLKAKSFSRKVGGAWASRNIKIAGLTLGEIMSAARKDAKKKKAQETSDALRPAFEHCVYGQ